MATKQMAGVPGVVVHPMPPDRLEHLKKLLAETPEMRIPPWAIGKALADCIAEIEQLRRENTAVPDLVAAWKAMFDLFSDYHPSQIDCFDGTHGMDVLNLAIAAVAKAEGGEKWDWYAIIAKAEGGK